MPGNPFGFQIEETTGAQRSIILRGRALPYRDRTVSWEGEQHHRLTWYPGNPVGTLQVLGPREVPTTLGGMWKDRFLRGQVEISGFQGLDGTTLTAEQLIGAFDQLRVAGNLLRVQWGPMVRNGILHRFRATPDRIEDIVWEAEFVWSGRDDAEAPRAAAEPDEAPDLRKRVNETDDQLAFQPKTISKSYRQSVLTSINGMRSQAGVVFDRLRQVDGLVQTPAEIVGAVSSAVESIRIEATEAIGILSDEPYTAAQTTDRVLDVLTGERWRRTLSRRVAALRATAQRLEQQVREKALGGVLTVITLPGDTSLRQIAIQAYGTADAWQTIADFNGFTTSVIPGGTVVTIPPAPERAGGIQRGFLPT